MDRNIAELESIIDSSFEWKTKQWAMLSEQAIQTHHSKSVYFDKTFYEYSKIIEKKLSITKEKNIDDNVNLKFSAFLLLSVIGFKFI